MDGRKEESKKIQESGKAEESPVSGVFPVHPGRARLKSCKDGFASSHGGGGSKGERTGGLLSPKRLPPSSLSTSLLEGEAKPGPAQEADPTEAPARGRAALVSKARTVWMSLRQSPGEAHGERSESELWGPGSRQQGVAQRASEEGRRGFQWSENTLAAGGRGLLKGLKQLRCGLGTQAQ